MTPHGPDLFSPPSHGLRYAEVAVERPLDHTLSYRIPGPLADSVRIGSIVEVPLQNGKVGGVVVGIGGETKFKGRVKSIGRVLTPDYRIGEDLMDLARWLADYYWCMPGEALAAVSFIGLNDVRAKMRAHVALAHADHWLAVSREVAPDGKKLTKKQRLVVDVLLAGANEPQPPAEVCTQAGVTDSVPQTMLRNGWLVRVEEPAPREDDYPAPAIERPIMPVLTSEQAEAMEAIGEALHAAQYRTFLLKGVTGSGKTEVYLRAIEAGLRIGRTAIVLVPEISLTPQTVEVFRARMGSRVGVYHSRMTLGQKYDLWRKIEAGEVRVLIGARSAVFAPMPSLGLIVVDEEHETTYKQNETPRYHARDVAVWRASRAGATAILGSATPSLESFHNAREGKYALLDLPTRIGPHASPIMTVIDMKRHLTEGDPTGGAQVISPTLRNAIEKRLSAGEQTVLLLNRRGFANHVLCMKCEKTVQCPRCDVSLTYHKSIDKLICHWCGHSQSLPETCPKCGEPEIRKLGLGTQRIEELLGELFPEARTLRVDVDSMKGKRTFIEVWEKISRREVDIILGTQMIAKGLHLESVTLVGVISADFALFLPDFRSSERTFHLLTQVAGRAGRGDRPGEVIVQSFMPHHYAIEMAARLEARKFYERELHIRRMLRFPPIARLVGLLVSGTDQALVREQAGRLAAMLKSLAWDPGTNRVTVLGPAPAPIGKLEDNYRWRVLLRGVSAADLSDILHKGLGEFDRVRVKSKINLTVDVDPYDMM